jgi:GTP-binding protein
MNDKKNKKLPNVIIFGRPNVGKSTFFNCIMEKNLAITSNIEGTTRDRNKAVAEWQGRKFTLIDTGGILDIVSLVKKKKTSLDIDERVQKKVMGYLKNADLILFLVDTKTGLLPGDRELAKYLEKRFNKNKIILVSNKADNLKLRSQSAEFNKLNLGEPLPVSAANGSGTGDLLDVVVKNIKAKKTKESKIKEEEIINVCIIGRPNVGKSSLLNSLLGYERVIVSPIAHTTREPQDAILEYGDKKIKIVDTAGINKRGKISKGLEKHGILKSLSALKKSDIALLVIDASSPFTHQDQRLFEEITVRGASFVFVANKWDLVKDRDTKENKLKIYRKFPFATWAPIQFVSAKTGEKVNKLFDIILDINEKRRINLSDAALSRFLNKTVKLHRPVKDKGTKKPRIYELKQLKTNPPVFEARIGPKDTLADSYLRFIENRLRKKFELIGTPIKILISKKKHTHGRSELDQFKVEKKLNENNSRSGKSRRKI